MHVIVKGARLSACVSTFRQPLQQKARSSTLQCNLHCNAQHGNQRASLAWLLHGARAGELQRRLAQRLGPSATDVPLQLLCTAHVH